MNCREEKYGEEGVLIGEPTFAHQILCKNKSLDERDNHRYRYCEGWEG